MFSYFICIFWVFSSYFCAATASKVDFNSILLQNSGNPGTSLADRTIELQIEHDRRDNSDDNGDEEEFNQDHGRTYNEELDEIPAVDLAKCFNNLETKFDNFGTQLETCLAAIQSKVDESLNNTKDVMATIKTQIKDAVKAEFAKTTAVMQSVLVPQLLPSTAANDVTVAENERIDLDNDTLGILNEPISTEDGVMRLEAALMDPVVVGKYVSLNYV